MIERSDGSWLKISSVLLFLVLSTATATAFEGGTGTSSDPYEISTCQQLQDMNQDLDAHYELVSDINCSDTENWNNGKGFKPIGSGSANGFNGSMRGNSYSLEKLYIDNPSERNVGLVSFMGEKGLIKDLKLRDVRVIGFSSVGGLVGFNNGGTISSSSITAEISGTNSGEIGGLVGYNKGKVIGSYSNSTVTGSSNVGGLVGFNSDTGDLEKSFSLGNVSGEGSIGGLVGRNAGRILHTYAKGGVEGTNTVIGGLVGKNTGDISESFSSSSVSGYNHVGGLTGDSTGTISKSYWNTRTSGQSSSDGGRGLSTSEMIGLKAAKNMNFDWENSWRATEYGYPELVRPGFEGGNGTESDPYVISTCEQLQDMENDLDAHYELVSDVDCRETEYWNNGKGFDPVGVHDNAFIGFLNGSGNFIADLYIERTERTQDPRVGLFGRIRDGEVRRLGMLSPNITSASNKVGAIAGGLWDSEAHNVYVQGGRIYTSYQYGDAGGIAGSLGGANTGLLENSFVVGTVIGGEGKDVSLGGLAATMYDVSTLRDSYASIKSFSSDTSSYSIINHVDGSFDDLYYDEDKLVNGTEGSVEGIEGLSTGEMQGLSAESNMAGLDFSDTWESTFSYPKLSWMETGDGTESDPYMIYTCHDLQAMENDLDAHYELANDIDCSMTENWNNGKGFRPVGDPYWDSDNNYSFNGSLDGDWNSVNGVYISRPNEEYVGLVGVARSDSIIQDLSVVGSYVEGAETVGGVLARSGAKTVVKRVAAINSTVKGDSKVGGLMGLNIGSVFSSFSTGSVSPLTEYAQYTFGGLIGNNNGNVSSSYSHTDVVGVSSSTGGLAGNNYGNIRSTYATGSMSTTSQYDDAGGLVGSNGESVSSSYWDTEASGQSTSAGSATGLTTSEMQGSSAKSNMPGLSFESNWSVVEGDYPVLQWQLSSGDGGDSSGGDDGGLPGISICDSRGPLNQCISNSSHSVGGKSFSLSSRFVAETSAVFEALDSMATISVDNSTSISGLWRGSFSISTGEKRTRLQAGAKFRPEGGEIVIGG